MANKRIQNRAARRRESAKHHDSATIQHSAKRGNAVSRSDSDRADLRRGEVVTVAWSLTVLTTLGAQIFAGLAALIGAMWAEATAITILFRLLIVSAAIAGVLSLILLPMVYRFRQDRPPTAIVVASLLIAAAPLAVIWAIMQ